MTMAAATKTPVIHLVDDDAAFQEATSRLLRAAGYEVRCYVNAGAFLLARLDDGPGCVLLDVNMPGPSGLDLQESLVKRDVSLPVVFLTGYGDVPTSVRALKAGATDFLTKPATRETLLGAIQEALLGTAGRRVEMEQARVLKSRYETLTAREIEVFERVVAGKMNKQIAYELGAAERTIKAHRAHVMQKMEAATLAQLVEIAVQLRSAGATRKDPPALT